MNRKIERTTVSLILCALIVTAGAGCKKEQKEDAARTGPAEKPVKATERIAGPRLVKEAVVAGSFYSANPAELKHQVQAFLGEARPPQVEGRVFGLICPHAGHRYSGPVAALSYKALAGSSARRFVIIGASHRVAFPGVFVLDADAYRTPLGEAEIDREGARKLIGARPWISSDERMYGSEHSLEVQIPFLQEAAGQGFQLVLVLMGRVGPELPVDLARALDQVFPDNDTVFIASTDMSHGNYPPYKGSDQIRPVDLHTLELIEAMDIDALEKGLADDSTPLCGGKAVLTLMHLFRMRGGSQVKLLGYGDSGDTSGDHSKVVGYGAAAFLLPEAEAGKQTKAGSAEETEQAGDFTLTSEDKRELLRMARACVDAAVKKEPVPSFGTDSKNLTQIGAAFVTLKRRGDLRGCIGTIVANEPLYQCVQRRAVDAAIHDSRFVFNPIRPEELGEIEVEISVLTPPRPASIDDIVVGRDGVLLTLGMNRGVFLPQVPIEQGWDRDQYLMNLCRKAHVSDPNCFRRPDAQLASFQAIVFSEHEMGH